jgi:hypothetical protein
MSANDHDRMNSKLASLLQGGCTLKEITKLIREHGLDPQETKIIVYTTFDPVPIEGEPLLYFNGAQAYEGP